MGKKKAPEVYSGAPGYGGPPPTAPGGAVTAYGGAAPNGAPMIGPPPARADQLPFVNASFLWQLGRPFKARIKGVRDATGSGNAAFDRPGRAPKKGWFLDVTLENGQEVTGRINEGDTRHQRLWDAYQDKWVGRNIVLRLTNPGDIDKMTGKPSKAAWMLDTQ